MSGDAYARNGDPETSHEAAASTDATRLESLAYRTLFEAGVEGLTAEQLSRILNIEKNTISPRLRPLARKGLIIDSGRRRKNETGKRAIVWIVKKFFVDEDIPTFSELHSRICEEKYENFSNRY